MPPPLHCSHRPPCPGCPRFGKPGLPAAARTALEALAAAAGLGPPVVVEGPPLAHRLRARLMVRGRAQSPKIGLFQEDSHRIVDIPSCVVHHPLVNRVAAAAKVAMRRTGTAPYADASHRGAVRALQVVVERPTQHAQVVVVANGADRAPLDDLARALAAELGETLHSLWWNGNPTRTNSILGPHWHRWHGAAAVEEIIGGARVYYPPAAFGQTNLDLADRLVAQVAAWVPAGARVAELYAGVGAIGLGLVARAGHVAFNEVAAGSLAGLEMGRAALGADLRARTSVHPGPAAAHLDLLAGAEVVIVDPPRKGLDADVLAALVHHPPPRLVVISCSLEAFLREAQVLMDAGGMRLAAVVPVALFPFTDHVETLALFERA